MTTKTGRGSPRGAAGASKKSPSKASRGARASKAAAAKRSRSEARQGGSPTVKSRKSAVPAARSASRRPASRRTEPALGARTSSPVAAMQAVAAAPVPVGAGATPAVHQPLRLGPRFPDGDYDYTYLHDFLALDYVPGHCRAVVFGCGKGEEAVFLSERGYRVTGLDSDRNSVGLARERAWLNSRDVDFMIGEVYESATLLPAESFGLASDRGFFRSLGPPPETTARAGAARGRSGAPRSGSGKGAYDPVRGERERRRFLDLVRRLLLPGGVFLLNATEVAVGRKAKATRKRKKNQDDLLVFEGGEVMGEVIRAGLEIVGRRQYPVTSGEHAGDPNRANLLLYCRKS